MSTPPPSTTHPGLSVAIVCRDNVGTIGRTLESVRGLASQVVALDSGSTDGTLDVLRAFGAEVVEVAWAGHVRTKQMALDRCTQPWAMHLDSDESLTPALRASVREALGRDDPAIDGYEVNRKVWWNGRAMEHAWQPEWRLRLVRRGCAAWGGIDPHDAMEMLPRGEGGARRVGRLRGDLRHDSFDSIARFLEKQIALSRVSAESLRRIGARGRKRDLVISPVAAWCKQMVVKGAWRDGWRGWAAASGVAAAALMKHAILLELTEEGDAPTR